MSLSEAPTIEIVADLTPETVRTERRAWTTLDIATVALVARLAVVVYVLAEPVWDGHYYDLGARRLAAGLGYSEDFSVSAPDGTEQVLWQGWAHYPIGYPAFLALFFKLFGTGIAVPPLANALTGAALAMVVHRLALHMFGGGVAGSASEKGEIRAMLAGMLVALHPGLVLYSGAPMTEPLAALCMLGALLIAVADERPWRGAALGGVTLGLATLVRPNAILLAPLLALAGPARQGVARWLSVTSARLALVAACALCAVAPWTYRNCRVMDACAFVSTNAGWNLVIGSAPGATGKFEFLVGHTPSGGPECAEGGQVAQDRCWWRYGVQTIKAEPGRFLRLVPAKLHYLLDSEWFPINYLREARPDVISASTHLAWGRALSIVNHALIALAAVAAIGRPARKWNRLLPYSLQVGLFAGIIGLLAWGADMSSPKVWPLAVVACVLPFLPIPGSPQRNATELGVAGMVLVTLVTHAVFFGEDRYHLVATPALALLAAGVGRRMAMVVRGSSGGRSGPDSSRGRSGPDSSRSGAGPESVRMRAGPASVRPDSKRR
jgi:hypothetical protein